AAVDGRVVLGGKLGGVDDVLDAEGHAVQPGAARHAVELARLGERLLRVDERPRAHYLVALRDALEAGRGERLGAELARLDAPRRLRRGKLVGFHPGSINGVRRVFTVFKGIRIVP